MKAGDVVQVGSGVVTIIDKLELRLDDMFVYVEAVSVDTADCAADMFVHGVRLGFMVRVPRDRLTVIGPAARRPYVPAGASKVASA